MVQFTKWQEWAIPLAILAGLFVILTPLPTMVIDFLLAVNMIAAIMILTAALLARSAADLSVFPAILLVSTLGRLVLNISTTRLILSNATSTEELAAGGIINRFGDYVIGSDVFVGIVIFAIIFIVQFVVVTKGTSRISEVAARFALDGMPGKQMAIDADLKAKLIDAQSAQRQRTDLQEQADFLGAMDGAGRFVRGDAIAGLIITLVNIFGGLGIGLASGMDLSTAVDVYTKLTIGDGLASQIPAFLIAISAGMLLARGSRSGSVSDDLVSQITIDPRVPLLAGVGALAMTTAGMPWIPMTSIAVICFLIAANSYRNMKRLVESKKQSRSQETASPVRKKPDALEDLLRVDHLEIRLGVGIVALASSKLGGTLSDDLNRVRRDLLKEFGFILPKIRVCDQVDIKENQFQILLSGDKVGEGEVYLNSLLAIDHGHVKAPIHGRKVTTSAGQNGVWIEQSQKHRAEALGYRVMSAGDVVTTQLRSVACRFSGELLTRDCTAKLIDEVRKQTPVVVDELIPGRLNLSQVQQVLKNLLSERVSIRQLALILEALGDYSPHTKQVEGLVDQVRIRLSRSICSRLSRNQTLYVAEFESEIELEMIEQHQNSLRTTVEPSAGIGRNEFKWFVKELQIMQHPEEPVLLVDQRIRSWVKNEIGSLMPELNVLGRDEVCEGFQLRQIGEISLQPKIRKSA